MSIKINKDKCMSCSKCYNVCPGSLIDQDDRRKAFIKYPQACWGCTACLKECAAGAIQYYLGADIGGKGGFLYTSDHGETLDWHIVSPEGKKHLIKLNKKESNRY
ncbi:4Fe-4S dicluster domain-containing protein [Geosporobacter ferrireducens]|uniref:Adenylylsulfate reductase n=1 Tax=Geosporobacter ferrireducens TaxID=1424294 RepID=A0A1D8GE36_9FIRM|nr:4Fe-4S dicluster domain-containing protein [Geosporobacter ferrireducens]AOT69171.1 adenylylsulfate reductase [Geosporobacter ferrireducens]MTI56848.1 4Fe-4S dicluster domain-containing protein [Geosporobacter ferrireducens]